MAGYKEPSFKERVANAAQARETALAKLKSKPQLDEAEIARLKAEHDAREAKRLRDEAAALAAMPPPKAPEMSAEEKKAIRDAKYAARKARKGR